MGEAELRAAAAGWIADDPDEGDRAELQALLDAAAEERGNAVAELRDRFADRLHFGTAGLRGVVAAGPNRMNRAVVRAATAAVAGWLLAPGSAAGGCGGEGGGTAEAQGLRTAGVRGAMGRLGAAGSGSWWGATRGTGRRSSRTRWRGCWRGRGSRCTCCRGPAPLPCWRSRSGTWACRPGS